jgi:hypothetical protein
VIFRNPDSVGGCECGTDLWSATRVSLPCCACNNEESPTWRTEATGHLDRIAHGMTVVRKVNDDGKRLAINDLLAASGRARLCLNRCACDLKREPPGVNECQCRCSIY